MPWGTERCALEPLKEGGLLFPAQAICPANYPCPASRVGRLSFLLQLQLSKGIFSL